jgi:hypothetical protein
MILKYEDKKDTICFILWRQTQMTNLFAHDAGLTSKRINSVRMYLLSA